MPSVDIFTGTLNAKFIEGLHPGDAVPLAPIEQAMEIVPSKQRIETYPWMTAAPGIQQYMGHRRLAAVSPSKFSIENREFDGAFSVAIRDIEDDQAGGYAKTAQELGAKAAAYPRRAALTIAGALDSTLCFDGSYAAADTHNFGTGDNLLTQNNAASDAGTYKIAAFITNTTCKPLLWQDRKSAKLMDDWTDKISSFRKSVNYWCDMEGAALPGRWWDMCLMTMTDLPTLAEMQVALQAIMTAFRSFQLPKALTGDPTEYVHEQLDFTPESCLLVCDTRIEQLVNTVLNAETLTLTGGPATNIYRGKAKAVFSQYMGG